MRELVQSFSGKVVLALLGAWMIALVSSAWWLAPGNDDAFYLFQVFSFIHSRRLAYPFLGEWHDVYTNLPAFAAVEGAFFALWNALGLPLTVYTLHTFQTLSTAALLLSAVMLLRACAPETLPDRWVAACVFLVLIGVTPFAIDVLYQRPEGLGLLCIVLGLLCYAEATRNPPRAVAWLFAGGIALGSALLTHPNVSVCAGLTALGLSILMLRRGQARGVIAAAIGTSLPLGLGLAYFIHGGAPAWDALIAHSSGRASTPFSAALGLLSYVAEGFINPRPATLFRLLPFMVVAVLVPTAVVLAAMRLRLRIRLPFTPAEEAVSVYLATNVLLLLLLGERRIQLFTVVSFGLTLGVAALLQTVVAVPARAPRPQERAAVAG